MTVSGTQVPELTDAWQVTVPGALRLNAGFVWYQFIFLQAQFFISDTGWRRPASQDQQEG